MTRVMTDKIIIKNLTSFCSIGVTSEERIEKQPLIVDITLVQSLREAGMQDNIQKTINYAAVCSDVRAVLNQEYHTLEGVAESIATTLKNRYGPEHVIVCVKKPGALARKGVKYAAVLIER